MLFWWWFSSIPDFNSFVIRPVWDLETREDVELRYDIGGPPQQQEPIFPFNPEHTKSGTFGGPILRGIGDFLTSGLGVALVSTIAGGAIGGALVGKKKKRRRKREALPPPKQPQDLSIGWRDITDGMMTDFLFMAAVRMALVDKGIISEDH